MIVIAGGDGRLFGVSGEPPCSPSKPSIITILRDAPPKYLLDFYGKPGSKSSAKLMAVDAGCESFEP